jgi:uncharacterized cupredoxin-like copper-binding protein
MIGCSTRRRAVWPARRCLVWMAAACLSLSLVLASPPPGRGAASPLSLIEREFVFLPRELTVTAGDVAFVVRNQGAIEHNLVVQAANGVMVAHMDIMEPGEIRRFSVSLPAGIYTIYCSLPGHRDAGMSGTLRVRPGE